MDELKDRKKLSFVTARVHLDLSGWEYRGSRRLAVPLLSLICTGWSIVVAFLLLKLVILDYNVYIEA